MFGSKKETQQLEQKIEQLTQKIGQLQSSYEEQIRLLRQQLSAVVMGVPPAPSSILSGLPYSEIPKAQVSDFIKNTFNLMILDVRGDEGWNNGHIPNAKHIPAEQVPMRVMELADHSRPILTICTNGNTGVSVAQFLAKEGFRNVFNALGGMAGYSGPLIKPQVEVSDEGLILGEDRELIRKVIEIMDREIRPGLKRDGGDLKIVAVENKIVKIKMVGACLGCGSQKRTVEDGIKNFLIQKIPEIQGIEDLS